MNLKRKLRTPQGYATAGMVCFLSGIFANMVADGRLLGELFIGFIPNNSLVHSIQVFANGFSIPMLTASIFFSLRGISSHRIQ